jgi:hypothetical protein
MEIIWLMCSPVRILVWLLFLSGFAHLALLSSGGGHWVSSSGSSGAPPLPTAGAWIPLVGDGSQRSVYFFPYPFFYHLLLAI